MRELEELEKLPLKDKVKFMGKAYAYGDHMYNTDPEAKKQIDELNKAIYEMATSPDVLAETKRLIKKLEERT